MRKFIGSIFVAIAVLLPAGAGRAADDATCNAYVNEAVVKAEGVRQFKCGFDLNDPRWGADRGVHTRWCQAASREQVAREQARRRGEMKLCQTCRAYADVAVAAAADNVTLKCGYEGPRWNDKAEDHFGWCIQQRQVIGAEERNVAAAYQVALQKTQNPLNSEMGARVREAAACKARHEKTRNVEPKR